VALVAAVASRLARAAVEGGLEAAEEVPAAEPLLEGRKPMVVPAVEGKMEELPDKRAPLAVAAWKGPAVVAPAPPPRF